MSKNLIARLAVAAIFIPLILYLCIQGGAWLFGFLTILVGLAIGEYLTQEGVRPLSLPFVVTAITTVLLYWAVTDFDFPLMNSGYSTLEIANAFLIAYFMLAGMYAALGKGEPGNLFRSLTRLVWGVIYVGVLYGIVFRLGGGVGEVDGSNMLIFLFAVLWIGDTAAMWAGKSLGKRKLAPAVSPNKTVEGFIGGLLFALATALVAHFTGFFDSIPLLHLLGIGLGASLFGQLGDIVESLWKRSLGIKDSSNIIPGHGGILDRFDSLLFAAPFTYFYLLLLQG